MVIIGDGALLIRALRHCVRQGIPVGGVVSTLELPAQLTRELDCECRVSSDVNQEKTFVSRHARSGVVWSINNKQILRGDFLSIPGVRFYNIHGGLVEQYRGLSEVCVFFAILRGESVYGATLHEIDTGIDTGAVVKQLSFQIGSEELFHTVMSRTLAACETLFETTCVSGHSVKDLPAHHVRHAETRPFTYGSLPEALAYRHQPSWVRATQLGPYAGYFPRLASWIENADRFA